MKPYRVLAALLAAAAMNGAQAGDWMPTAGLQLTFGGPSPARLTASIGSALRSSELPAPLPLSSLSLDSRGIGGGKLLGVPLQAPPAVLRQDGSEGEVVSVQEETSGWSSTWLWVGAGAVVLAAALAGTDAEDGDTGYTNGEPQGCNAVGVTGDVIGPREPEVVILGPDCEGVPGGGVGT